MLIYANLIVHYYGVSACSQFLVCHTRLLNSSSAFTVHGVPEKAHFVLIYNPSLAIL